MKKLLTPSKKPLAALVLLCLAQLASGAAMAQGFPAQRFPFQSGEDLYHNICQGCHMPDAKGAVGAGAYPALAANKHLKAALYPVGVVMSGRKAMPSFGEMLTDEQIAAVVNFVRTSFGNKYKDKVTPEMVKVLRPH
jgi:mono/diheme cytochrome c family protein